MMIEIHDDDKYLLLFPFAGARITKTFRKWIVVDFQLSYLHFANEKKELEALHSGIGTFIRFSIVFND